MITGVVHITSKTLYGYTSRNVPIYMFVPFDKAFPHMLVGCSQKDKTTNVIAIVQKMNDDTPYPRGFIMTILGKCGDKDAEYKALLHRYSPQSWSNKDMYPIKAPSDTSRYILDLPTVSIDPPGCKDIDDCITVWHEHGDLFKIIVTIADVSAWIEENPWLVEKASQIGQTFYKNGSVVNPMLPSELSDNLCSLLPRKKRYGYSLFFDWNGKSISNFEFKPVIVTNYYQCTYENIHEAFFPVEALRSVCSYLAGYHTNDPHVWVEQLMILYNTQAAGKLIENGMGILRVHSEPDMEKLNKYTMLGDDVETLAYTSAKYVYTDTELTHWGLGGIKYCHATSPIRRWSDVINQFALKGINFWGIVDRLNTVSSNAKKYERDCFFLEALLNQEKPQVTGIVIDVQESKIKIWVYDWKRIITVKSKLALKEGDDVALTYYLDMGAPTWKKRMVFRVEDINYLGQQYREQLMVDNLARSLTSQCLG